MGGMTLQTFKLASIPSFSSSRLVFKPLPKALTFLARSHHGRTQRPPFPLPARALSAAPAVQTAPDETDMKPQWKAAIDFKWVLEHPITSYVKPQWKAAIDFKWILEHPITSCKLF